MNIKQIFARSKKRRGRSRYLLSVKVKVSYTDEKNALTAHVSIVFIRYMVLSVEKRLNEDDRTVGELFFLMADELQDITFNQSMVIIVQALIDSVQEFLHLTDDQINSLLANFVSRLPAYLRDSLHIAQAA